VPLAITVQCDAAGRVMLKLKTPWRNGTTHRVMSPRQFMPRLAARVPRPRLHLIRFHGVLAPHAKLRAQVVAAGPRQDPGAWMEGEAVEPDEVHRRTSRISWARQLRWHTGQFVSLAGTALSTR